MAVAREPWPDWSACFLNDEAPLAALAAAIEERAAVVPELAKGAIGVDGASAVWVTVSPAGLGSSGLRPGTPAPTVGSRLAAIRAAIESLAPAFVDLENPAASWAWGSSAPFPFLGVPRRDAELPFLSVVEGEHSLAAFSPGIGALEAHEPTLAAYRKFLTDCAWWLERFRYVDVGSTALFLRRIDEDSDGRRFEYDTTAPASSNVRRQVVRTCFHRTQYALSREDGQTTSESREASQYANLRVHNPAPLDGDVVLYYRHNGGQVDELTRTLSITEADGVVRAASGEHVVRNRVAGETVQTLREDISYAAPEGAGVVRRTDWTETAWSADGTLSADTTGTSAVGDPETYPRASRTVSLPALIAPLEFAEPWTRLSLSATVPARGAALFFDDLTACPTPRDLSSWAGLLPDSPATRPGTTKRQVLAVEARAWLEVFLDYNASFRYRAADEEEEPAP